MRKPRLQSWIHHRQMNGTDEIPLINYGSENIMIGRMNIMRYMQMRSTVTFHAFVEKLGFPSIKLLDGRWATTMSAIDTWIFLCSDLMRKQQRWSKQTNGKPDGRLQKKDVIAADALAAEEALAAGTKDREELLRGVREAVGVGEHRGNGRTDL